MSTTTVRLDDEEERMLDRVAAAHGGRSNALKAGLRLLDAHDRRAAALSALIADWSDDDEQVDEPTVAALSERYRLAP